MHVGDRYVVSKERFDNVAKDIERVREIAADVSARPLDEIKRLNAKFIERGDRITREQFDRVKEWFPLTRVNIFKLLIDASCELDSLYGVLSRRIADFKKKDEEKLHRFYQLTCALGHFTLLLGSDSGFFVRQMIDFAHDDGSMAASCLSAARFMDTAMVSRGAWLAGVVGKPLLVEAKRRYKTKTSLEQLLSGGLSLIAVGLTHRKYRAEVSKALAPDVSVEGQKSFDGITLWFRHALSTGYERACKGEPGVGEDLHEFGTRYVRELFEGTPPGHALHFDDEHPVPQSLYFPLSMQLPLGILDNQWSNLVSVIDWMPLIARASNSDFYVEEKYKEALPTAWDPECADAMVKSRKGLERIIHRPLATPKAAAKPERNAPCPCGSGKKYKRCCARKPASDGQGAVED
jgi:hypothetical protein